MIVKMSNATEVGLQGSRCGWYGCPPDRPRPAGFALHHVIGGSGDSRVPDGPDREGSLFWLVHRACQCGHFGRIGDRQASGGVGRGVCGGIHGGALMGWWSQLRAGPLAQFVGGIDWADIRRAGQYGGVICASDGG